MFAQPFFKKMFQGLTASVEFEGPEFWEQMFEKGVRVGLDIGSSSIKIIEVEGTAKGPVVKTIVSQQIPRSFETQGAVSYETLVAQSLVELWRSHKIKSSDVRLIISDPTMYMRYLTIPKMDHNELHKALRWQIEKYVPFPIEEASVDYQVVDHEILKDKADMGLIVVALERKVIDKYLRILKAVKVLPTIIDITAFSVAKALMKISHPNFDETTLAVDIGAHTTSIVVAKAKNLLMVRSIEIAGDQITQAIVESCQIERAAAETLKRQAALSVKHPGDLSEDKISAALCKIASQLSQEIERSLTYCEREGLVERVDKIILLGGGAKLKGLSEFIAEYLSLPVEVADITKHIVCEKPNLEPLGTQFWAAYGGVF